MLQVLGEFNIEHCEEPIICQHFMALSRVRAASFIPIMADESYGDEHDAARLTQLQACQLLNIKLGKSSGFHRAQKIDRLGYAAGLTLQVGGFRYRPGDVIEMPPGPGLGASIDEAWLRRYTSDTPAQGGRTGEQSDSSRWGAKTKSGDGIAHGSFQLFPSLITSFIEMMLGCCLISCDK